MSSGACDGEAGSSWVQTVFGCRSRTGAWVIWDSKLLVEGMELNMSSLHVEVTAQIHTTVEKRAFSEIKVMECMHLF